MKQILGEVKAQAFIDGKKTPVRACKVSGSWGDKLKEFGVSINWERMSDEELWKFKRRTESDLDLQTSEKMKEMPKPEAEAEQAESNANITKQEKLTEI